MMELILVEGVTDVQMLSYYLQNVYGWKYTNTNSLGIRADEGQKEHIENLIKGDDSQITLCGVGGTGKFNSFIQNHRINELIDERDISSVMLFTDRDSKSIAKIVDENKKLFSKFKINRAGQWIHHVFSDSFEQEKEIDTYLLVIPDNEMGALERVLIKALYDYPDKEGLIKEVEHFIDSLEHETAPELKNINNVNKAKVGTFCSISSPKNAMRFLGLLNSGIDWKQSETLRRLFSPLGYLGIKKPVTDE